MRFGYGCGLPQQLLAEVVTPLTEYHTKAEARRKHILEEEKKCTSQMKAATDALMKQKISCLRMLDGTLWFVCCFVALLW